MATPPVKIEIIAPGLEAQVKKIEESFLRIAKANDLLITATGKATSAGDAIGELTVQVKKLSKDGTVFNKTFKIAADKLGEFDSLVKKTTADVKLDTKALTKNAEAARLANRAKGAKGAVTTQVAASRARLGPVPTTPGEEVGFQKAVDNLKKVAVQARATKGQVEKVFGDVALGQIVDYGNDLNLVRNSVVRLLTQQGKLGATFRKTGVEAQKAGDQQFKAALKTQKANFDLENRLKAQQAKITKSNIEAARKASKARIQEADKVARATGKQAEKAAREAKTAANAQVKAAQKAAQGVIDANLKAERFRLKSEEKLRVATEKAANARAKEEDRIARATGKQAEKVAREANKAANTQVKAAQKAADAVIDANLKAERFRLKSEEKFRKALVKTANQRAKEAEKAARIRQQEIKDANKRFELIRKEARERKAQAAVQRNLQTARGPGLRRAATPIEKGQLAQAEAALRKLAKTTEVTGKQIDRVFADVSKGQIRSYEGALARVQTAVLRIQKAERALGATAEAAHNRGAKAAARQRAQLDKTRASTKSLASSFAGLAKLTGISLLIGAAFRLQQALIDGTEAAVEFSKRIAEIQTIQGNATVTTEDWQKQLTALSNAYGIPVIDQAEAAYQSLSNQVTQGADTFLFLESANKLAVAAVTSTSNAVNLLTSVINAYGFDVLEAEDISAKLFKTVELGRVRIDEMSETLGRIAVPAEKVGIRFEELLGAIAVTTRQGIRFNEAATLLRGIIQKLVKPTEEMKDLFKELGFNSAEAATAALGLPGVLAAIEEKTRGSSTEIGKLFNRIRASTGALIFAGENLNVFNEEIAKIDNTTVEDFGNTVDTVTKSAGKQFEIEITKINNVFKDFGQDAIAVLVDFNNEVGGVSNILRDVLKGVTNFSKRVAITFKALNDAFDSFEKKLGPIAKALRDLSNILPSSLLLDSLTGDIDGAEEEIKKLNTRITTDTLKAAEAREKAELEASNNIILGFKERNKEFLVGIAQENAALFKANKERLDASKDLKRIADAVNAEAIKGVKKLASTAGTEFNKLSKQAENTATDITRSFLAASKQLFDFDISLTVDQTQIRLIDSQLTQLRNEQQTAIAAADKTNFERVTKQIQALTKQRFNAIQRVAKTRRDSDKKVSDARAELIRAEGSQDRDRIQSAKQALQDAQRVRKQAAITGQEELDIQQQIVDTRRKLRKAGFRTPEAKALQQELRGLQSLQLSITQQTAEQDKQRQAIVSSFERERKLRLQLQTELNAKAEEFLQKQLEQQRIAAELLDLDKQRRAFSLDALIKEGDPEKLTKEVEKQADVIRRSVEIQEKLGLKAEDRIAIESEIGNIRKAAANAERQLSNKLEEERIRKKREELNLALENLRKEDSEQNKIDRDRLDRLRQQAKTLRESLKGASLEERGQILGTRNEGTFDPGVTRSIDAFFGIAADRLEKIFVQEEKRPGTTTRSEIEAAVTQLNNALDTIRFTRSEAQREGRTTDDPRLAAIGSLFSSLQKNLEQDVAGTIAELSNRQKTLTELEETLKREIVVGKKHVEEGEQQLDQRKRFRVQVKKIQDSIASEAVERQASQTARQGRQQQLTGGTQDDPFSRVFEAGRKLSEESIQDQVKANHIAGAKAQRNAVVQNQVDAALAAEKALRAQKKRQKEILQTDPSKLTGIAQRIALADKGRGESTASIRKREADARAAQRKRNEDFLRARREQKLGLSPQAKTTGPNISKLIETVAKETTGLTLDTEQRQEISQLITQASKGVIDLTSAIGQVKNILGRERVEQFNAQTLPSPTQLFEILDRQEGTTVNVQVDVVNTLDGRKLGAAIEPIVTKRIERASRQGTTRIQTR
jgi:TP901 family phage tail tape measure protein